MIEYNTDYDPPAPILEVTVTNVSNQRLRRTWPALVDTGADITALPEGSIEQLKLYPIRLLQFEDLHANASTVYTYKARLVIANIVIPQLEVVPTGLDFVVIGRDVLNRFELHLYGPQLAFEIST